MLFNFQHSMIACCDSSSVKDFDIRSCFIYSNISLIIIIQLRGN